MEMSLIPYGRQDIQQDDIDAVIRVLNSDFLTQGPTVPKFEDTVKNYCSAEHAVAVNSATSALHISLLAIGIKSGDQVWTSPNTFVATANAALYCGATIDFVDIDPSTYNLCPLALEKKLKIAKKKGSLPQVVIPVHLTGQPCDMRAIYNLSLKYGFNIIEDASHAIGGSYANEKIGNCRFSDITIFSFHPVKIITSAEGGMALTNNKVFYQRLKLFRSHGITRDPNSMTYKPDGPWYYEQVELGYNYRMNDIQAAIGLSQMDRIDDYIKKRHLIAKKYDINLRNIPIILPKQISQSHSSYHLYVVRLLKSNSVKHLDIFKTMRERIIVNLHYIPVYRHPYYKKLGFRKEDFPHAEAYYNTAISLPIFPTLSDKDLQYVINTISEILSK